MIAGIEVNLSLILNIIRTIIDLLLVWYILYLGISMFKQNMRTMQLFKGVLIILLIKLVTSVLGLSTMSYLVDTVLTWGIIAVIVIFQPEIRSLLEKMGQTKRDYHIGCVFWLCRSFLRDYHLERSCGFWPAVYSIQWAA